MWGLIGRVRGRVLASQEHQPLPPNRTCTISTHPALQVPPTSSVGCLAVLRSDAASAATCLKKAGTLRPFLPIHWMGRTTVAPSPYPSRNVGDPPVSSRPWYALRPPLRLFPFPTGWVRWKLRRKAVPFPTTSDTGNGIHFACKSWPDSHDWGSSNQP